MASSFTELFRVLASFSPPRTDLRGAPWADYVPWAIAQGLAPLAAYNLEYRLVGAGAPQAVREKLLSLHQGVLNDNVMKLVNFKRAVDELEGRRVMLFGGAAFADALYPHVAFRPVSEVRLLVSPGDLEGLTGYLARADFKPEATQPADTFNAERLLSDGRTAIFLHASLSGSPQLDAELLKRGEANRVYGPSMVRPTLEDALLLQVLMHSRLWWSVPALELIDVRELVMGASALGGPYSRPLDITALHQRAKAWGLSRALWVSLQVTAALFPETAGAVTAALPSVEPAVGAQLQEALVSHIATVGRTQPVVPNQELTALLAG